MVNSFENPMEVEYLRWRSTSIKEEELGVTRCITSHIIIILPHTGVGIDSHEKFKIFHFFTLTLWLPKTFLYCFKCNALRWMFYNKIYNKINLMAIWSTGHPGSKRIKLLQC